MYTKYKLRPNTKYRIYILAASLPGDCISFSAPTLIKTEALSMALEEGEIVEYPPIIVNDNQFCNDFVFGLIVEHAIISGIRKFLSQKYKKDFNSKNCVWLNVYKPKLKLVTYVLTDENGKIIKVTSSEEEIEKGEDL